MSSILVYKRRTYTIQPNASSRLDISKRVKCNIMDGRDAIYYTYLSLKALLIFVNSTRFINLYKLGSGSTTLRISLSSLPRFIPG